MEVFVDLYCTFGDERWIVVVDLFLVYIDEYPVFCYASVIWLVVMTSSIYPGKSCLIRSNMV